MIKYHLTALALKGFSCCEPARGLYRGLGNRFASRKRNVGKIPFYYFESVERNVAIFQKYGPPRADDLVLEIGTGWVHWDAVALRLFFDFHAVLYDVWDNRQLSALKSFVRQLEEQFGRKGFLEGCDFDRARSLIRKIEGVRTFDDLYAMLGFRYVVDRGGLLECLPRDAFRMAISQGVMQHIPAAAAPQFVSNTARLLVEGGLGIHSICIVDLLSCYDRSASPKQYLTYSESQWRLWCENSVQHHNRMQRSEWLRMFTQAGFSLVEESGCYAELTGLRIHPRYQSLSSKDIDCMSLDLVVRKG